MKRMQANRNISRIERQTAGGGFLVRVMRKGRRVAKFFADHDHGGKRNALSAARNHRDQLEAKLRGYSAGQRAQLQRSNNTSGVTGVRKAYETDYRWESEPTYGFWVAQWTLPHGKRRTRRFSIDKYGEDKAYRLAVQARKRGVASMGR